MFCHKTPVFVFLNVILYSASTLSMKITTNKVQECQVYKTCSECLEVQGSSCGWCSLENKCSLKNDCSDAAQDPLYWLNSGNCTIIKSVNPPQVQGTTSRMLNLAVDNLPVLQGQYSCVFTALGKIVVTNASRTANGISCLNPEPDSLPPFSATQHNFTAKLSVRVNFAATNFTFFDCSSYRTCTECVSSPFPCDWCIGGSFCTHDTAEYCRNDILVTGISSPGPSFRSGPEKCPRIRSEIGSSTEILLASSSSQRISVKADNIQPIIAESGFVCRFNIQGSIFASQEARGQLLGDTIYCDSASFIVPFGASNATGEFSVYWDGGAKRLDNPSNIHILVYRCEGMAQDCQSCLELPEKYGCGWCQKGKQRCQKHEECSKYPWLDDKQTCPAPEITTEKPDKCSEADICGILENSETPSGVSLSRFTHKCNCSDGLECVNGGSDMKLQQVYFTCLNQTILEMGAVDLYLGHFLDYN